MKKLFLLTCVLLLTAGIAAAQDTPPSGDQPAQPAQSQTAPADTTDQTTLRGCLSGSGENFTFTDQAGTSYRLGGDFAMLGQHVGHDVELTGKLGDTSAASDQADQKLFEVASVKMVAETCSTTDTARPEGDAAMTQPETQVATEQPAAPAAADPNAPVAATDPNAAVTPSAPVQQPEAKVEPEVAVQVEQPATEAEKPVTPDAAVEQPVVAETDEQAATEELPQTATFLPLLGLLGFGSLAAGLLTRRK